MLPRTSLFVDFVNYLLHISPIKFSVFFSKIPTPLCFNMKNYPIILRYFLCKLNAYISFESGSLSEYPIE